MKTINFFFFFDLLTLYSMVTFLRFRFLGTSDQAPTLPVSIRKCIVKTKRLHVRHLLCRPKQIVCSSLRWLFPCHRNSAICQWLLRTLQNYSSLTYLDEPWRTVNLTAINNSNILTGCHKTLVTNKMYVLHAVNTGN